jgi:hypothetical protein
MMELVRALDTVGVASVRVDGASMEPTVQRGGSVLIRRGEPTLGDVVVIRTREELIVHRLVARLPGGRWVHKGDARGTLPGVCAPADIVGKAELPRRTPSRFSRARYFVIALLRALFVVCSATFVLGGCKHKPEAPAPPLVIEVRVVDKTPPELPRPDLAALTRAAARVIGDSGLPVVDGGAQNPFRLRVEVRLDGVEEGDKGLLRAYVIAKLSPVGGPAGALSFEQGAVAERVYERAKLGDRAAAFRAHAERAVEDVVRGVGARARLARGSSAELTAALSGSDDDLREEAVRIAGERHDRECVPALVGMLKSEDLPTRDRAIGALAEIGDARAVKPLTEVARFRETGELPKVLDALASIGGAEARAYLEFVASGHENPEMRELAKDALRHLDARQK